MKKLFSLYFCFKNNGSLALPFKKKKKINGNLYFSRRTKKIKVSDSIDKGIKLIGQMKVLEKIKGYFGLVAK